MAYLAKTPNEDQNETQSQSLQPQNRGGGSQGGSSQGQTQLSNTAGETGGTAPGQTSNKSPGDFTKSNFSNASDILNRNQGTDVSAITNRLLGNTQQNADATNKQIADKTAQYKTDQTAAVNSAYAAPDQASIDKALGGDATATSSITGLLGRKAADPVAALDLGNIQKIAPSEFFQQGEYQPLLQDRSKGAYTSGMGALDSSQFNRSGGAQDVRDLVGRLQTGVDLNAKQAQLAPEDLQNYANTYLGQQQGGLKDLLTKAAGGVKSDISGRLAPAQQAAQTAITNQTAAVTAQEQKQAQATKANLKQQLDDQVRTGKMPQDYADKVFATKSQEIDQLDPSRFLNVSNPNLTEADLINQADASKYNTLEGWLGGTDYIAPSATPKAAAGATLNDKAFQDWLASTGAIPAYTPPPEQGVAGLNKGVTGSGLPVPSNSDKGSIVQNAGNVLSTGLKSARDTVVNTIKNPLKKLF